MRGEREGAFVGGGSHESVGRGAQAP
jgi:hypothetical protein